MKHTKEKGITILALVVSIVVMLILAGVSVMAVFGDNGLIEQVKESVLLTKLADVLFDIESDIVAVKMNDYDYNYTATEIISMLLKNTDKYKLQAVTTRISGDSSNSANASSIFLTLSNSPLDNLVISITGDIYVDNYKRGKIQLSDIYDSVTLDGLWHGESTIKLNDGSFYQDEDRFYKYFLY